MTALDQQIAQMEAMAKQHYPADEVARNGYMVTLLMQRLREYHAKSLRLEAGERA